MHKIVKSKGNIKCLFPKKVELAKRYLSSIDKFPSTKTGI